MTQLRFFGLILLATTASCHPLIVGVAAASSGGGGGGGDTDTVSVTWSSVGSTFATPGGTLDVTVNLGGVSGRTREVDFQLAPDGIGGSEPTIRLTASSLSEVAVGSVTRTIDVPASTPFDSYRLIAEVRSGGTTATAQFDSPIYIGPANARPAAAVWTSARFSTADIDTTALDRLSGGDVVVGGDWSGAVTPSSGSAPSSGGTGFLLARLQAADGSVVAEHFAIPQTGGDARARGIAVLADDSCVVAGFFSGSVDFGLDEISSAPRVLTTPRRSAFVAHYVFVGAGARVRNVVAFTSSSTLQGLGIAALPSGTETVVVGSWSGLAGFGGFPRTAAGDSDAFVMRLANDLSVTWIAQIGSAVAESEECVAVAARHVTPDNRDEIAVTGHVRGVVDIGAVTGPTQQLTTNSGSRDAFVVSYLLDGSIEWATLWGGDGIDEGRTIDLSTTAGGVVFAGGSFSSTVNFTSVATGAGSVVSQAPVSSTNGFVAQWDGVGNLRWASGVRSETSATVRAVTFLSGVEEVVVAGEFAGTLSAGLEVDGARLGRVRTFGDEDAFLVNLSTSPADGGRVRRQVGFGGTRSDRATTLLAGAGAYHVGVSVDSTSVACEPLTGFSLGTNTAGSAVIHLDIP